MTIPVVGPGEFCVFRFRPGYVMTIRHHSSSGRRLGLSRSPFARVTAAGRIGGREGGSAMCRLFGLHAGAEPVTATFWLLDAPDSLREQSHREPDGAGIGVFGPDGRPVLDKQPIAACAGRRIQPGGHSRPQSDLRRPRPLRQHRRAHRRQHPPVHPGRPIVRAQRHFRRSRHRRRPAGRAGSHGSGRRSDRQRADVRADHRARQEQRRGCRSGHHRGGVLDCRHRPGFRAESDRRDPRRALGPALPGHPRAVCPGPDPLTGPARGAAPRGSTPSPTTCATLLR